MATCSSDQTVKVAWSSCSVSKKSVKITVADPGSGAFLTPGYGIGKKSRYFRLPGACKQLSGFKILKFFEADPDPGSVAFLTPGSGMGKN